MNDALQLVSGAASPELGDGTPAVAPPSSTDGPEASPSSPANGDAAPLTPYQKRKQREKERKEEAAARRAKRDAAKAAKTKAAPAAEAAADQDDEDERDEAQRARETGGFWKLTLRVVSLCLYPFGYRLDPLDKGEVAEDVALLLPLTRRHKWLDVLVRYAALPYLLAERIAGKVRRRDEDQKPKGAAKP